MATSHAPILRISSAGVFADLEGNIKVYAKIPGEPITLIMLLGAVSYRIRIFLSTYGISNLCQFHRFFLIFLYNV